MGKEASAAAVATLNLIGNEHGTIFVAELLKTLGKLLTHELDAAHALDALNDAGADIALGQFLTPGLQVVEGQIGGVAVGIDGGDNLRVVGHLNGQRGTAVESLGSGEHTGASVLERGEFQCVLIGLGTAVDEE